MSDSYESRVRANGAISAEMRELWKQVIENPQNSIQHRHLIWTTAREAVSRLGQVFDIDEPKDGA